ncbi:MAG: hypothetical protein COB90_10335 [Hyphomicrobiales bacterium]|nr:MAG: hypothetical protein COB90_10335 [Hyphomicrobiales bacterium]
MESMTGSEKLKRLLASRGIRSRHFYFGMLGAMVGPWYWFSTPGAGLVSAFFWGLFGWGITLMLAELVLPHIVVPVEDDGYDDETDRPPEFSKSDFEKIDFDRSDTDSVIDFQRRLDQRDSDKPTLH